MSSIILIVVFFIVFIVFFFSFSNFVGFGNSNKINPLIQRNNEKRRFIVSAHRGSITTRYFENSKQAFDQAVDMKKTIDSRFFEVAIEVDLCRTRDGYLVCHHSQKLEDGRMIADISYRVFKEYAISKKFTPLTLEEIFEYYPDTLKFLEIKEKDYSQGIEMADRIIRLIREHNITQNVVFGCLINSRLNKYIKKANTNSLFFTRASFHDQRVFVYLYYLGLGNLLKPKYDVIELPTRIGKKRLFTKPIVKLFNRKNVCLIFWENDKNPYNKKSDITTAYRNSASGIHVNDIQNDIYLLSLGDENETK